MLSALKGVTDENKIESSETLPSLRISPRESLKIVRQMIKQPISMFRDEFFELVRVVKPPQQQQHTVLEIADFSENFAWSKRGQAGSWLMALKSAKSVSMVKLPSAQ